MAVRIILVIFVVLIFGTLILAILSANNSNNNLRNQDKRKLRFYLNNGYKQIDSEVRVVCNPKTSIVYLVYNGHDGIKTHEVYDEKGFPITLEDLKIEK